jgi:hypothetical protein
MAEGKGGEPAGGGVIAPLRLFLISLSLPITLSCTSAAPAGESQAQPLSSAENPPYPPLDHPTIKRFAAAMDLNGQMARATDSFWLPGAAIVRERNPGSERKVDALVSRLRAQQDGLYIATALFGIDKRLTQMLVPAVAQAKAQATARSKEIFRTTHAFDSPEQKKLAADVRGKLLAARPRVDQRLDAIAKLAATPAGVAWLAGLAKGNFRCLPTYHMKASNQAFADKLEADHCKLAWMPEYDRLVATADGRQFAELSSALYVSAMAAMAMSFDAGLSLERFLPRREVEIAGLIYPEGGAGSDELARRYNAMVK